MLCKMDRFVNKLTVDVMVSNTSQMLSVEEKEHHFQPFPLKHPVIIETAGLKLLLLFIRMSRKSTKD